MNAFERFWNARSQRDRLFLKLAAGIAGVALVITFVAIPIERSRTRLARELPELRASIAALQRDADEAKRLRSLPAAAPSTSAPLVLLATNAGGLAGAQIAVLDAHRVRVTGGDIAFGALLEWLRNAQTTHGMRVESARLERLPAAGRVRAELVLARS
jgi:general secretion pathway protein M